MATSSIVKDRRAAWIAIVERHIRLENAHDLEGVLDTFGDNARYDDEPWEEHHIGRNGVRAFYEQLMKALPDLEIEVQRRHVGEEAMVVEVMIRGTHLGGWRGLPATRRRVEFPLCGVYTFDADDRLAGPWDGVEAARRVSRAYEPIGAGWDFGDPSGHDYAGFDEEAGEVMAGFRG